jgi:hypothetical protein
MSTPQNARRSFWNAFLDGLAAPAFVFGPPCRHRIKGYPHASELEALRSDWNHVGEDLRRGIEREKARSTR